MFLDIITFAKAFARMSLAPKTKPVPPDTQPTYEGDVIVQHRVI